MFLQGLGYLLRIIIARYTAPRTVFTPLATTSLLLCGSAVLTPWWEPIAQRAGFVIAGSNPADIPPWSAAAFFFLLTVTFSMLSHIFGRKTPVESLVHTPVISSPVTIGNSTVRCFCGSIELVELRDVIVTSENRELTLGSIAGTSVSGRVRRMAAQFDALGNIVADPLHAYVEAWKSEQSLLGPFQLGTILPAPAPNALAQKTSAVILAVALEKRDDGINGISETANHRIIKEVLDFCDIKQYTRIFIPIFGIGSGGVSSDVAVDATIAPLVAILSEREMSYDIYLGTYRSAQAASTLAALILRAS